MKGSIRLTERERKRVLKVYRSGSDGRVARRAHVLLLLTDGVTWEAIRHMLYASNDLIAEVRRTFLTGGVDRVLGEDAGDASDTVPWWRGRIQRWVQENTPQDFGYFRSRWSCATLAEVLAWETGVRKSAETIRRKLHELGFVWRRPRPIVGPIDPEYAVKLRRIKQLLRSMPDGEVAVFQDEVDVHLNPGVPPVARRHRIGSMWMIKGQQAEVVTPGNNRKCHVSGSLVWNTGTLLVSRPEARRNADLFLSHLDDLRRRLRCWKRIHVICDNARFHNCQKVWESLQQWRHRLVLHFLPKYAPETNPIERVWWHLHETITRNHKCQTLPELVQQAFDWFHTNNNHYADMRNSFAKAA